MKLENFPNLKSMANTSNLITELAQFIGTKNYYSHWLNCFTYTDGIQFLCEKAPCYWLLDAIASYQPKCHQDTMLRDFQIWYLLCYKQTAIPWIEVKDNRAVLACWRDKPQPHSSPAIKQSILFTDFPLPQIKLYFSSGVLMLPNE